MTPAEKDFVAPSPSEPRFFPPAPAAAPAPVPAPAAPPILFVGDSALTPEAYCPAPGVEALLGRLAALLRLPGAPTPFAVGLLAPAGGGKSSALAWLAKIVARDKGAAVVALDAAALAAEPERALASALYRALAPANPALVAQAAREAEHFGADAGSVARAAQDRLENLRKTLIADKQALAETQARRAALPETLLFDTPGSKVDTFARRMRAGFEARMKTFGLSGDPLTTFKDLTRDLAAAGAAPARLLAGSRALYAYRGQIGLLVYAAVFYGLSLGADWLATHKTQWLGALTELHSAGAQSADFLRDRLGFLPTAAQIAFWLALACVALNLWRAFSFSAPALRAASLLDEEVATHARELDAAAAHQARAIDRRGAEAAQAAQAAQAADKRAEQAGVGATPPGFVERDAASRTRDQAQGFLHGLSAALAASGQKLVVALDGFERAPASLPERLGALLARPGLVAVFALDPRALHGDALARLLQLPLRLDAAPEEAPSFAALDSALTDREEKLLAALAPLAGSTPRAQKRLRNFYAFLRPAPSAPAENFATLGFCLAAGLGADDSERAALDAALRGVGFAPDKAPRLTEFLNTAQAIFAPVSLEALRRTAALTRTLSAD